MTADNAIDAFNLAEAAFWFVFAPVAVYALRRWSPLRERLILAAIIIIFGVSDLVEAQTPGGGWWAPWWLATWKFAAGGAGLGMGWAIWRRAWSHR